MNHVGENDSQRINEYAGWYPCTSRDGFIFIWKLITNCIEVQERKRMSIVKKSEGKIRTTQENVLEGTITIYVGTIGRSEWWTNVGDHVLNNCRFKIICL